MKREIYNTTAVFLNLNLINNDSVVISNYRAFDDESCLDSGKIVVEIFDLKSKETTILYIEALNFDLNDRTLRLWSDLDLYYEWLDKL